MADRLAVLERAGAQVGGVSVLRMHKRLLLLGLLREGPLSGYELHRIVRAHGDLYADMKKANIYYLLERLAEEELVSVTIEPGTRGRRGERLIYELTPAGRGAFIELLREVVVDLTPPDSGVGAAVVFLSALPKRQALSLLAERRRLLEARREALATELSKVGGSPLGRIASDHLLALLDAEIEWLARSLASLETADWRDVRRGVRPQS